MPVRSDMKGEMKRYGSQGSLNREMRLSTASDNVYSDRNDSMYRSSPDLSQGSLAHTRSSSTDSAEGGYYGNHSRQSSGSTETYPTRLSQSGPIRKVSTSTTADPLQFVKIRGAQDLAKTAEKQIEITKEVNKMRGIVDGGGSLTEDQDWQSNFKNWKNKRRQSTPVYASVGEADELKEEKTERSTKTFGQMMAEREKRRSLGPMSFYPLDDNDLGSESKPTEPAITKSLISRAESTPEGRKSKKAEVAPWARDSSGEGDSQSDSETNNSHQSGDTDSVFSDKSTDKLTPSKIISDDDSWVKSTKANNLQSATRNSPATKQVRPLSGNFKQWETNVKDVQRKDDKKKVDIPKRSGDIRNLTKAYEQKDKDASAEPVVMRRSQFRGRSYGSTGDATPPWKSLDLSDSSHYRQSEKTLSPLSPTAPKALVPKEQRFSGGSGKDFSPNQDKKYTEKMIKISQKPNNDRGFGFTITGGMEKKQPITVSRVSLGSAADVNELEFRDEILTINDRDVSMMTLAQVQAIVDHSVKRGQLELQIRRYIEEEEENDSMEEQEEEDIHPTLNSQEASKPSIFQYPTTDTKPVSSRNHAPLADTPPNYSKQPTLQVAVSADSRPRLMDQLEKEKQQQQQQEEANNNDFKERADQDDIDASNSETVERMVENFSFSSHSMPKVRGLTAKTPDSPDMKGPPHQTVMEERPTIQMSVNRETSPGTTAHTEERSTIIVAQKAETPTKSNTSPVLRRHRTPERIEAIKVEDTPSPPTLPKAEPPPLATPNEDSGFGPPAALLRWQKPRTKAEYISPFPSTSLDQQLKSSKRLSSTLPYNSKSPFSFEDYSKDDSNLDNVSVDSDLSKSSSSLRNTYHFDDSSRQEDWLQKQEKERKPDAPVTSYPPIDNFQREEHLTAQSGPIRRTGQVTLPDLSEIIVPSTLPESESSQEKFELEQARIRKEFEEDKRRAQEAEKKRKEEEQERLSSDKLLQSMEAQIVQTKHEAELLNMQPIKPAPTQPRFNSEPMTIKMPTGQGRQFVIDPRNQDDSKQMSGKPEYTFRVDLQSSQPPLRTLKQEPELSQAEILEQERQRIREEEMRKLEEEKRQWKEEQERKMQQEQENIRLERERLKKDKEKIEQEKALLEQKKHQEDLLTVNYHSPSHNAYSSPASNHQAYSSLSPSHAYSSSAYSSPTSSSPGSSISHSPKSPPPALDPNREAKKKPPPTAPKPDKNMKARLTREDLLMMNRKPTPMTKRPEGSEDGGQKQEYSGSVREPPTKAELHSLNAVPKQKFHSSGAWIKEEEPVTERPFVIGKRSDLIHNTENSNPQEHWLVKEAERRRIADQNNRRDFESVTAHAGPTKPSQSALVSRFRGDVEPPPRTNRYSYPSVQSSDSPLSPSSSRPLSSTLSSSNVNKYEKSPADRNVLQFSAKTQPSSYSNPSLSQTLPTNFSFNANLPPSRDQPSASPRNPRSPSGDSEAVIAVSGKQKCSHCGEELGFGAAMVIESLGLYYHVQCFRCCVCRMPLGNGSEGADVRVRVNKLHCKNCYSNDEAGLKFSKV